MPKITIASLERRIMELESEKRMGWGQLSISGEFQLEAFKRLLAITSDMENMLALLESGEWSEHCTKSELGQRLEAEITELQNYIFGSTR